MHATPRRKLRPRWVWSVLVLGAVIAMTVWLIRLQEGACAATPAAGPQAVGGLGRAGEPSPDEVRRGTAVYHDDWSVGLCSFNSPTVGGLYVSLAADAFDEAALCGAYLDVTGPDGTVRAQIVDRCRGCVPGRIDLSRSAFQKIGDIGRGVLPVRYRLVRDPMPPRRLGFRVKTGSSSDWMGLLVFGHGNPIGRLEVRDEVGGAWTPMRRGVDNYWVISGAGEGPFQVRVTDRYGRRAVARKVSLAPGRIQPTRIRMYEPRPAPFTAGESPFPVPLPTATDSSKPSSPPPQTSPRCP